MEQDRLVILVVAESGLRSMLAARLALAGIDVMTARNFDEAGRRRTGPAERLLVTDAGAVAVHPGGLAALADRAEWQAVVMIGEADNADAVERLHHVSRIDPAAAIAALARRRERAVRTSPLGE